MQLVFKDFDGVIKETVDIKWQAFADLFRGCTEKLNVRITKLYRAIRSMLQIRQTLPHECLLIGDSGKDQSAAEKNGINFLLRRRSGKKRRGKIFQVIKDFKSLDPVA
ncbi:MAG: hypothetical protein EBZ47_04670 [Chlamydiae bacterium]|nr:hypothetical protein [Chlamydiota bacterium]